MLTVSLDVYDWFENDFDHINLDKAII